MSAIHHSKTDRVLTYTKGAASRQPKKAGTAQPAMSGAIMLQKENVSTGSEIRRYVTFYFTNMPDMVPYFYVKEGFEVCRILDNLFLSWKRNKHGHIYGFVRYANVKDK